MADRKVRDIKSAPSVQQEHKKGLAKQGVDYLTDGLDLARSDKAVVSGDAAINQVDTNKSMKFHNQPDASNAPRRSSNPDMGI